MTRSLVVLAAGRATRFGRLKQLEPVGPGGEALLDYAIHDAVRAGFGRVVLVVRRELINTVRSHVVPSFASAVDLQLAVQSLEDLPASWSAPGHRRKPWGTGHAVLAARRYVEGSFAVCNADDFYGAEAYETAAAWLERDASRTEAALMGYELAATLSSTGGVSRAVCAVNAEGTLTDVGEVRDVSRKGDEIVGLAEDGATVRLGPDEVVSMNFWVFPQYVMRLFQQRFTDWLHRHGDNAEAEFLIPAAVADLVRAGKLRVRVLPVHAEWWGITFSDDVDRVARRLAQLQRDGTYPVALGRGAGRGTE